jgi:alkylhydroperoxidase family enzyme
MTTNYERAFEDHPDVYAAWEQLGTAIRAGMDLRRYELATFAAAKRLRSSYCCLAHGTLLAERFREPVREIAVDHRRAGLSEVDVAVMDLAEKVVGDASAIGASDLAPLRALGLTNRDIVSVVLAAAARCFFSKTLDALDVRADADYRKLDDALLDVLVVGRAVAET